MKYGGYGGISKLLGLIQGFFSKYVYVRLSDLFSNLEKPEERFEELLNFAADIDLKYIFNI